MIKRAVMHDAREIVVALNATNQAADALDVAIDAATALGGRLSALFVQDEQLLRLAELPFAALVGPTGERRPLPPIELELSLRMAAQNARSRLEHAARLERLESTFRVVRGRLLSELRRSASSAALVVSTAGRLGSLGRGPGDPVVILADSEGGGKLVNLAKRLAEPAGGAVVALAREEDLPNVRPLDERGVRLRPVQRFDPATIAEALESERGRLLLVERHFDECGLRVLLSSLTCPLGLAG